MLRRLCGWFCGSGWVWSVHTSLICGGVQSWLPPPGLGGKVCSVGSSDPSGARWPGSELACLVWIHTEWPAPMGFWAGCRAVQHTPSLKYGPGVQGGGMKTVVGRSSTRADTAVRKTSWPAADHTCMMGSRSMGGCNLVCPYQRCSPDMTQSGRSLCGSSSSCPPRCCSYADAGLLCSPGGGTCWRSSPESRRPHLLRSSSRSWGWSVRWERWSCENPGSHLCSVAGWMRGVWARRDMQFVRQFWLGPPEPLVHRPLTSETGLSSPDDRTCIWLRKYISFLQHGYKATWI